MEDTSAAAAIHHYAVYQRWPDAIHESAQTLLGLGGLKMNSGIMRIDHLLDVYRSAQPGTQHDILLAIKALIEHRGCVIFQGRGYLNFETLKDALTQHANTPA